MDVTRTEANSAYDAARQVIAFSKGLEAQDREAVATLFSSMLAKAPSHLAVTDAAIALFRFALTALSKETGGSMEVVHATLLKQINEFEAEGKVWPAFGAPKGFLEGTV